MTVSGSAGDLDFSSRPAVGRRALLDAAPLIVLCFLPLLLYAPFLNAAFERDEGVYATIAQGLLDGRIPYRDLFDNKPPLIFGWYAFSFLLLGEGVYAPRIVAAVLLSCTTLLVFAQARLLFPRGLAYAAAGAFALSTGLALVSLNANTEVYMLLPLVASLACFTVGLRGGHPLWFFLAGAMGGIAIMTKQVAVWNLLALVVIAGVWGWRSASGWRGLAPAALLLAGGGAAVAAVLVPFAATGTLDDLLYANVSYVWLYVRAPSFGKQMANLAAGVGFFALVAAPLVAGAVLGAFTLLRRRAWTADYLVLLWAFASAVGVTSGGRYFPHYFVHLLPAMAVLTAVALHERIGAARAHPIGRPALALGAVLLAVAVAANVVLYLVPSEAKRRVADNWYEQARWEVASRDVGSYLAAHTTPDDTIYNFGRETQIYFYADRRPAARYVYDRPFWWNEPTFDETMEALRRAPPAYIVDSAQPPLFEDYARYHPAAFLAFLSENYDYLGRLHFADVYRLKEASS